MVMLDGSQLGQKDPDKLRKHNEILTVSLLQTQDTLAQFQLVTKVLIEALGGEFEINENNFLESQDDGMVLQVALDGENNVIKFRLVDESEVGNDGTESDSTDDTESEVQNDS